MINYERAINDAQLHQILKLQKLNLRKNVSEERQNSQGFVTAEHTFEQLKLINDASNAIIATSGDEIIAYALAMKRETGENMPVFKDLFAILDQINYDNKPLKSFTYIMVGQLCVAEEFRGLGIVEKLYANFAEAFQTSFDAIVTDISATNPRSMRVHEKSGFVKIHTFYDSFTNSEWEIVLRDLRRNKK